MTTPRTRPQPPRLARRVLRATLGLSRTATRPARGIFGRKPAPRRRRRSSPPRLWWAFALVAALAWNTAAHGGPTAPAWVATVLTAVVYKTEPALQRAARRYRRR